MVSGLGKALKEGLWEGTSEATLFFNILMYVVFMFFPKIFSTGHSPESSERKLFSLPKQLRLLRVEPDRECLLTIY